MAGEQAAGKTHRTVTLQSIQATAGRAVGRAAYRTVQATQWQTIAKDKPIARPRTRSADRGLRNGNTSDTLSQDVLDDNTGILGGFSVEVKQKRSPRTDGVGAGAGSPILVSRRGGLLHTDDL